MVVTDSLFLKRKGELLKDCKEKKVAFRLKGCGNTV